MTVATATTPTEGKAHTLLSALRDAGRKGVTADDLFSVGIANPDWLADQLHRQYPDLVIDRRCVSCLGGTTMRYTLAADTELGQGTLL